jgi:hypothetical protein
VLVVKARELSRDNIRLGSVVVWHAGPRISRGRGEDLFWK